MTEPQGRRDIRCWWFGINNRDDKGHMRFEDVRQTLEEGDDLFWSWGGSTATQRYYDEMAINDSVVFWMGNGPLTEDWGILGFGYIVRIEGQAGTNSASFIIRCEGLRKEPYREQEALRDVFGEEYGPLKKFSRLAPRSTPYSPSRRSSTRSCAGSALDGRPDRREDRLNQKQAPNSVRTELGA
jgi:hypothetical protein